MPRGGVEKYINDLQKKLSELTGWNVTVTHVMDHAENGMVYLNRSDIYVYAIHPETREPIDSDALVKALTQVLPKLKQYQPELRLRRVSKPPKSQALTGKISLAEIALIVICCIIILTALLACCIMFQWWKRRESDKVSSEYMIDSTSSGPRPYDTETLDRKTAASVLTAQNGIFAHPPKSVVSSVGNRSPMEIGYQYEEDSSGGSNGSVVSRRYLYYGNGYGNSYGNYHPFSPPGTVSTSPAASN